MRGGKSVCFGNCRKRRAKSWPDRYLIGQLIITITLYANIYMKTTAFAYGHWSLLGKYPSKSNDKVMT